MACCCVIQPATGVHCYLGVASIPIPTLVCWLLIEVPRVEDSARGFCGCGLIHRGREAIFRAEFRQCSRQCDWRAHRGRARLPERAYWRLTRWITCFHRGRAGLHKGAYWSLTRWVICLHEARDFICLFALTCARLSLITTSM